MTSAPPGSDDMDVDHPERDQNWDDRARKETETERLDRNWSTLLQEQTPLVMLGMRALPIRGMHGYRRLLVQKR